MKIVYITAGAGGMFCGSCMHDNTLAAALVGLGHDCLLVPTYTPIRTDEADVSLGRVFFGGISISLEQKYRWLRRMPRWLDRLLSRPGLLRWVSRLGIKTRPETLGDLTLSMLKGKNGFQALEVDRLVGWLADEIQPEIVCLTNILISGFVPELKRRLNVPVLCTLQGDDIYLDWLPPAYRTAALDLIRANASAIDGYLTTSRYYADFMRGYLGIPPERTHVVYPGLNLKGFPARGEPSPAPGDVPTIGYFARICPEKGLQVLIAALGLMRDVPWRLKVAGYCDPRDRPFLEGLQQRVVAEGWADRCEWIGEVDHAGKVAFLRGVDVLSVPTTYHEPKGLYVLEAWACGVPVVQPRHGSFPELLEVGGGVLVEPDNPAALAAGLRGLLADPAGRAQLGRQGQDTVHLRFHADHMAKETLAVFQRYRR